MEMVIKRIGIIGAGQMGSGIAQVCAAAGLDVTDPEPLPADHPLWRQPGALISPHVGGASSAFFPRADRLMAAQLRRFMAGQPLENIVKAP